MFGGREFQILGPAEAKEELWAKADLQWVGMHMSDIDDLSCQFCCMGRISSVRYFGAVFLMQLKTRQITL